MKRLFVCAVLAVLPGWAISNPSILLSPAGAAAGDNDTPVTITSEFGLPMFGSGAGCTTTFTLTFSGNSPASYPLTNVIVQDTTNVTAVIPKAALTGDPNLIVVGTVTGTQSAACSSPSIGSYGPEPFSIYPRPVITSVTPTSASAGTGFFQMTVSATGIASNSSVVQWTAGSTTTNLGTLFGSPALVLVPGSLLASPGTATITIKNPDPAPNGVVSNGVTFTVNAPKITSLVPAVHTVGCCASGFTLAVNGSDFIDNIANAGSIAKNGVFAQAGAGTSAIIFGSPPPLPTTVVSPTQLTATVPASLIASPGLVNVTVQNPIGFLSGGAVSAPAQFTVLPAPVISSLSPSFRTENNGPFTLTINGANFYAGDIVVFDDNNLTPTAITGTSLAVSIPANLLTAGTHSVFVLSFDGVGSNALPFTVNRTPDITSISPPSVTATAPAFTLTVNGTNFLNNMVVRWNTTSLATTFVNASQLKAQVPASLITSQGSATISVITADSPPPAVVSPHVQTLTILPRPVITGLNPNSTTQGHATFTILVQVSSLPSSGTVQWNGTDLATTLQTQGVLQATVPASLVTAAGTASVTVKTPDGAISLPATFTIGSTLKLLTTSLPAGTVGTPYYAQLLATGGTTPYAWSITSPVPAWLTLNASTGEITGVPTATSTGGFIIAKVTDSGGQTATGNFSFTVRSNTPPLTITTTSPLSPGTLDQSYAATISATGGNPPYRFNLAGGSLPNGLSFDAAGNISGKPAAAGTFGFTAQVTDNDGTTAAKDFTLVISTAPLVITTNSPLGGVNVGDAFSDHFAASGGLTPYVFAVSGGRLPPGALIGSNGQMSGKADVAGTYTFTMSVRDSQNPPKVAFKDFTITVGAQGLTITTQPPLGDGEANKPYSANFSAAGGTQPYTWSASGAPGGLAMNASSGTLSGTPADPGSFTVAVTVSDAAGATATKSFGLTIAPGALSITTTSLGDGIVGSDFTGSVSAAGGVQPYAFTASGLPGGVSISTAGVLSGKPAAVGTFSVTVTVTDRNGAKASKVFTVNVKLPPLTITTNSPLAPGTVGSNYSASIAASGGTPPYTFAGSGSSGLAVAPDGTVSGKPTTPGTFNLSVTVTDSAGATATKLFDVTFNLPPVPTLTITGAPDVSNPGAQPQITLGLGGAYPVDVTATVTLTFKPDTGPDDPAVQLATGGRTAQITIPAGATAGASGIGFQTGTVAGLITITVTLQAAGQDVTPAPVPVRTVRINPSAPTISSVRATRSANGFDVTINGFSTTREVTQAIFRFTAASGASLQTTELTITVGPTFATWFQSAASAPFGSMFTFTQPFQGDNTAVASVTVILVNGVGQSQPATANLQ